MTAPMSKKTLSAFAWMRDRILEESFSAEFYRNPLGDGVVCQVYLTLSSGGIMTRSAIAETNAKAARAVIEKTASELGWICDLKFDLEIE